VQTPLKALLSHWWVWVYQYWLRIFWLPSFSIIRIHTHQRRTNRLPDSLSWSKGEIFTSRERLIPHSTAKSASKQNSKRNTATGVDWWFQLLEKSKAHRPSKPGCLYLRRLSLDSLSTKESVDGYKQCQREDIRSQVRSVAETYDDSTHLNKRRHSQWTTDAISFRSHEPSHWITTGWWSKQRTNIRA